MKNFNKKCWVIFVFVLALLLCGCDNGSEEENATVETETQIVDESTTAMEVSTEEESTDEEADDGVDSVTLDGLSMDILEEMTVEEKVGQMFFFGLDTLQTDGKTEKSKKLSESMKDVMNTWKPGGIILYSKNMKNQKQTKSLIQDLQDNSEVPLFIGTEEAGGENSRIASVSGMEIKASPSSAVLGTKEEQTVYETASDIASYMKELGFNVDFAPSANLAQEENSIILGENSFGSDGSKVAEMVTSFIGGLQDSGVSAVLSPFPGLGAATDDTRKGAVDIAKTISELRKTEFVPFSAGIEKEVDFITVGHASYSLITENRTPASLSKLMVSEILRKELQFESVIITDSMNERAILEAYTVEEAAVKAVKAGADMLLYPDEKGKAAYQAVLSAVKTGEIEESRIDESVLRILKVKIKRGLIPLDTDLIGNEPVRE